MRRKGLAYLSSLLFIAVIIAVVLGVGRYMGSVAPQSTVTVYFANLDGYLARARVPVPAGQATPEGALLALLAGPGARRDLVAPLPPATKLLSLRIVGVTARVDLSPEFDRDAIGGTTGDELRVMAIVDTLTEWPQIANVRLTVGGHEPEALSTHLELDQPIDRDLSLLAP